MDQSRQIKINVKYENGLQMQIEMAIATPYQVFVDFLREEIQNKSETKTNETRSVRVNLEGIEIQEDEVRTLEQLGFQNNCNVGLNRQQLTVNFEINIEDHDTIKFQEKIPNKTKIKELYEIVHKKVYYQIQITPYRQRINQIQFEEIFELSKQKNQSIESVLYENCKLIFDVTIIEFKKNNLPDGQCKITLMCQVRSKKFTIQTDPKICKVGDLQCFLEQYYDSAFQQRQFKYHGQLLDYTQTLERYGIHDGSQIDFYIERKGG